MSSTARFMAAAIVAPHSLASTAGRDVFAQGGTALEAAVAALAITSVVQGHLCGPGGDSTWIIREPGGKTHVIEAGSSAGQKATLAHFHKAGHHEIPRHGSQAVLAAPGMIGGMELALEMARAFGGRLPLSDLFAPAVKLAREGFPQSTLQARAAPADLASLESLASLPGFAERFLVDGAWPEAGLLRRAVAYGDTLEQLAHAGLHDFYRGDIARELAQDLDRLGAPLLRADLHRYEPRLRKPLTARMGAWTLLHAGPPTLGLASQMAALLHARLGARTGDDFASMHALIEAAKRATSLARPMAHDVSLSEEDPANFLLPEALQREMAAIAGDRAAGDGASAPETSAAFIGAIDPSGLAVACISTLHQDFGSGCLLPRTGVLMGNRGAAFSLDPASPHALAPGLRAPCAPAPALAVKDEGLILSYGSGLPSADLQVFARIAAGMGLAEALDMPRFSFGRTGRTALLQLEDRFDPTCLRALERAGHEIRSDARLSPENFGLAGALLRRRDASVEAAADPRGEGAADGL